jgi:hypothetical protein
MPIGEICEDASDDAEMRSAELQIQAEFLNMPAGADATMHRR